MDYKQKTIDSYDKNASYHAKKFVELTDIHRRREFDRFIELLPNKAVLDLGCGAGDHAAYFKNRGLSVSAIDLSEKMVLLAKQKGINASVMDIENLSFPEGAFGGVWAVTSLLHIPKDCLLPVLKKLHAILKDNGVLYVCVKKGEGEGLVRDKVGSTSRFFSFWQEDELVQFFSEYFDLIEIETVQPKNRVFIQVFFRKK